MAPRLTREPWIKLSAPRMMHMNNLPAVFLTTQDAAPAGLETPGLVSADFAVAQIIRRPGRVPVHMDCASQYLRLDRARFLKLLFE